MAVFNQTNRFGAMAVLEFLNGPSDNLLAGVPITLHDDHWSDVDFKRSLFITFC